MFGLKGKSFESFVCKLFSRCVGRRRAPAYGCRWRRHGADWRALRYGNFSSVHSKPPHRHTIACMCWTLADSLTMIISHWKAVTHTISIAVSLLSKIKLPRTSLAMYLECLLSIAEGHVKSATGRGIRFWSFAHLLLWPAVGCMVLWNWLFVLSVWSLRRGLNTVYEGRWTWTSSAALLFSIAHIICL